MTRFGYTIRSSCYGCSRIYSIEEAEDSILGGIVVEWELLLTPWRLGCPKDTSDWRENPEARNEFQRDFDRIVFNADFRRLNGKTQVFPFPQIDGIHTRLTHSLECASVGRSLGTLIGNKLREKSLIGDHEGWEIGALVSAACLAHDIGNPPFGHSGEKAIREFFNSKLGDDIISPLSLEQRQDFTSFDGNAMGFHVLTHTNPKISSVPGGLGLTYPALAAFVKYPCTVMGQTDTSRRSEKKPGFFSCHTSVYEEIANELGIPQKQERDAWYRHPLAFITEAADDICYTIIDLEDGYKHDLVSLEKASDYLKRIIEHSPQSNKLKNVGKIRDSGNKLGYLRSLAIYSLICQVFDVFVDNESRIRDATFDQALIDQIPSKDVIGEIEELSKEEIYSHRPVLQIEAAGFQVLPGLLGLFLSALKERHLESSRKILSILNSCHIFDYDKQPYEAVMSITKYVARLY